MEWQSKDPALRCIEALLETGITETQLLRAADLLTAAQYCDVVDERNIDHICGYPLCDQQLVNVPKQKYRISTATNQVFDITQRKKFCSAHCFKSSNYYHSQLSTLPPKARTTKKPVCLMPTSNSTLCKPVIETTISPTTEPEVAVTKLKETSSLSTPPSPIFSLPTPKDSPPVKQLESLSLSNKDSMLSGPASESVETDMEFTNKYIQQLADSLEIWSTGINSDLSKDVLRPPLHNLCVNQVQKSLFLTQLHSAVQAVGGNTRTGIIELASTFRLTSKCVTYRPPQWRLIASLLVAIYHGEEAVNSQALDSALKDLKASREDFDGLLIKAKELIPSNATDQS